MSLNDDPRTRIHIKHCRGRCVIESGDPDYGTSKGVPMSKIEVTGFKDLPQYTARNLQRIHEGLFGDLWRENVPRKMDSSGCMVWVRRTSFRVIEPPRSGDEV
jgi:hypothetical protein